ncbi:TonB-dependent receptor [Telluria beijingensis]|uniref:TonB-dependent receptor n=1 Tax=Telluria beijingensis TaxID=3068633 RepID=UPI002795B2CD|nr:TonB-dependent receptor [Massilia sp. REN29]
MKKSRLQAGVLLCCMSVGAAAADQAKQADQAPPAVPQAGPAPAAKGEIAEVIVTAQRRAESTQRSSLSIEVFGADKLQEGGIAQARDLVKLAPGLQIGQGGAATQIYVRGVGTFAATPLGNPAVAVNVDGVYVSRSPAVEGNFYDLERIEVVKGPQGTLYGRNASGGAINLITNKPRFDRVSGELNAEAGNYGLRKGELAVNLPVSSVLALRAAAQVVERDGYASQGMDDAKQRSGRLHALFKPSADLSLLLSADASHVGGKGPAYVFKGVDTTLADAVRARGGVLPTGLRVNGTDPQMQSLYYGIGAALGMCVPDAALAAAANAAGPAPVTGAPRGLCPAGQSSLLSPPGIGPHGAQPFVDNDFSNLSAELNWDLGAATLTVLPAYRKVENRYTTYALVTYLNDVDGQAETSHTRSLEVRLGNADGDAKWVLGAYYANEDQSAATATLAGALLARNINAYEITSESKALFGQVSYSLGPSLRAIGGLRHTRENRSIDGRNFSAGAGLPFVPGQPCYRQADPCLRDTFIGERDYKNTSYKMGVEYDLSRSQMLYLTLSTGYKGGGPNPVSVLGTANVASFYEPEKLTALQAGSRNSFLGNRLRVNMEGFYWKYKNAQQNYSTLNAMGNVVGSTANAGQATIYGAEFSVTYKPTPNDTLQLGVELLHSKFDAFRYASAGAIANVSTGCQVAPGTPFPTLDCSGFELPRAPKQSGSASWSRIFDLASGGEIEATLSTQFSAGRYLTADFTPASRAGGYVSGDFTLAYRTPRDDWTLAAFVRNLNDATIYTGAFTAPGVLRSLTLANIAAPRTWGLRLNKRF